MPTMSSTRFHKNCIMKMNKQMKVVPMNRRTKLLMTNISNFFIRSISVD